MGTFRQRIRQSIEDETLQIALDNNAERRLNGRAAAFASIPDWRARRQRARTIRADVIDSLDEYLAQFIAKNEEHGVIVHRAKDAAEAIKIILEISKSLPNQRGEDKSSVPLGDLGSEKVLIAKSKSMVSEEIELNHVLEAEGIKSNRNRPRRIYRPASP